MTNKIELAYLAGAIDADGCIQIVKHDHTSSTGTRVYSESVAFAQTSPIVVDMLQRRFGGHVQLRKRPGERALNWRPVYYWYGATKIGARAIAVLRPYLLVKAQQADLLLALRASKNLPASVRRNVRVGKKSKATNPAVLAHRENLYQQCRSLNRTGANGVVLHDTTRRTIS